MDGNRRARENLDEGWVWKVSLVGFSWGTSPRKVMVAREFGPKFSGHCMLISLYGYDSKERVTKLLRTDYIADDMRTMKLRRKNVVGPVWWKGNLEKRMSMVNRQ